MEKTAKEDLRKYYITPHFLSTLHGRARRWSEQFIKKQIAYFKETIPDYPEVNEILENELHRRILNTTKTLVRKSSPAELEKLKEKHENAPDLKQIIEVELEIRSGTSHLNDPSGET